MSKKLKEEERQQSLENYFTAKCTKDKTGKTADQLTLVPSKVSSSLSVKERTPPSIESEPTHKKLPKLSNGEMPNQILFEDLSQQNNMGSETTDNDILPKPMTTDNVIENEEDEELPLKTILYIKRAMQELIDPLEGKINQLLDTKKLQEDQALEINQLKDKVNYIGNV